jgi:DNA-binding MarR family transcriptional regulator
MNYMTNDLIAALSKIYDMDCVDVYAEFFQGELHTMLYLSQHTEEEVYPSILSDALHVTRARITSTLSALRKKGLIAMDLCEKDRRRMRVTLTEEGIQLVAQKQDRVLRYLDYWMESLGENNTKEMIRLIHLSADIMKGKQF